MAPPAAEAVIRLGSEGGAQTVQEINRTAGAMSELEDAASGMIDEFNRKPDVSGWSDVGKGMTFAAIETDKFSGGMVGLSKSIEDARVELGGFGLALDLVPGLGLVEAAVGTWSRGEEALTQHLVEKNNELRSTIELLDAAERAGVKLSAGQEKLRDLSAEVSVEVNKVNLARARAALEAKKEEAALGFLGEQMYRGLLQMGQNQAAADLLREATREHDLAVQNLTEHVASLEKGFAGLDDRMTKTTAALIQQESALTRLRVGLRRADEALEAVDPSKKYTLEMRGIEQVRRKRMESAREKITDEYDWTQAVVLINETAGSESALAWEKENRRIAAANKSAAAQMQNDWKGATDAMGAHVKGFASGLSSQIGSSTLDAAASFKNMADAMVAQLIRVAVQMVVMKFIPGAAPIVSAAGGFQHGGMIPAPRGQAVNITAHGGERVVSDTGRGAPMGGGGGGTSNKYYFQTGVLTPDSQRTMIRQISRTQRGTGEKAFPQ